MPIIRTGIEIPKKAPCNMPNKVEFNPQLPNIGESNALWQRAQGLIPAGTQTLAKGPTQFSNGVAPKYLRRGSGARVWDVDGNEFLDYNSGIGPIILGYCHPVVDEAIRRQLGDGITFSLMHPLEVELAELLRECIPNAESVRFSKTGCDVTSAAVRLARAFTRRERVLCCGYHGWHDWYITVTDRNAGIPANTSGLTHTFNYNDIDSVIDAIDDGTACVILEPFVFERENGGFLAGLREVCDRHGALLIFDEMWTGFRCALGGAQQFFGVRADLSLFSKAMANGMPISAITGRRDVMSLFEKDVFFFTTFGGEALSLAASIACIKFIRGHDVTGHIAHMGQKLLDGLNGLIDFYSLDYVSVSGYPFRTIMNFSSSAGNPLEMKTLMQQELIQRGILWAGTQTLSFSHTEEDVQYTLDAFAASLSILKYAVETGNVRNQLKGDPLQPVFRKTSHFNVKPRRSAEMDIGQLAPAMNRVG
jgi:glutamate-1-semialdehyde 2,1-aminomutase